MRGSRDPSPGPAHSWSYTIGAPALRHFPERASDPGAPLQNAGSSPFSHIPETREAEGSPSPSSGNSGPGPWRGARDTPGGLWEGRGWGSTGPRARPGRQERCAQAGAGEGCVSARPDRCNPGRGRSIPPGPPTGGREPRLALETRAGRGRRLEPPPPRVLHWPEPPLPGSPRAGGWAAGVGERGGLPSGAAQPESLPG